MPEPTDPPTGPSDPTGPLDPGAPGGATPPGGDPDSTQAMEPPTGVIGDDGGAADTPTTAMPAAGAAGATAAGAGGAGATPGTPQPTDDGGDKTNRTLLWVILGLIALLIIGGIVLFLVNRDDDKSKSTTTTSSSTSSSSTTEVTTTTVGTTTTNVAQNPRIDTFNGTQTQSCPEPPAPDVSTSVAPATPEIKLVWSTSNATSVTLSVDSPGIYGTYSPDGTVTVGIACDGSPHTYLLTALAPGKPSATQQISKTAN